MLADLRIELANGTKLHIVTDNDWTAENGAEVTVVAPYGKGAWGSNLKVPGKAGK